MEDILFYTTKGEFGCFTNYSKHSVTIHGINYIFPTSEHAYQSFKFIPHRMDLVELIASDPSPKQSGVVGRNKSNPMRDDWEKPISKELVLQYQNVLPKYLADIELSKDLFMYVTLHYKFTQHEDIKKVLLSTGNRNIIENSKLDGYWGNFNDGQNKLGKMLMLLRSELRSSHAS